MVTKRIPRDRAAAIEAFADAAGDTPSVSTPEPVTPEAVPHTSTSGHRRSAAEDPAEAPKTMLVRFPDEDLPQRIARMAATEDRTKHKIALMALQLGLDELERRAGIR